MDDNVTCALRVTGDFPPASLVCVTTTPLTVTPRPGSVKNVSTIPLETTAKTVKKGFMVMPLRVCRMIVLFVRLSVRTYVRLSVCPSVRPSVCLSVWLYLNSVLRLFPGVQGRWLTALGVGVQGGAVETNSASPADSTHPPLLPRCSATSVR